MNLPTIILGIFLLLLFALAIRYLVKNGTCSGCSEKSACHSASCGYTADSCNNGGCDHCSGCHK